MQNYQKAFAKFLITESALQFGLFELKNGRRSPYFFNSSLFNSGKSIELLGSFYALAIKKHLPNCNSIFGPAYKGIPICLSTAMSLSRNSQKDIGYFFNRKEKKIHGEKGWLLGKIPDSNDSIALVDDVITDGQTKIDAIERVEKECKAQVNAVFVAFDRMEQNSEGVDTKCAFELRTGIPIHAIVNIRGVLNMLKTSLSTDSPLSDSSTLDQIELYLEEYGVTE